MPGDITDNSSGGSIVILINAACIPGSLYSFSILFSFSEMLVTQRASPETGLILFFGNKVKNYFVQKLVELGYLS